MHALPRPTNANFVVFTICEKHKSIEALPPVSEGVFAAAPT